MIPLNKSKAYRKFVTDRDEALEKLFNNSLIQIDNVLRETFSAWVHICLILHSRANHNNHAHDDAILIKQLDHNMDLISQHAASRIAYIVKTLRRQSFILTVTSEAEAIGRALGKKTRYQITKDDLETIQSKGTWAKQDLERVITMGLVAVRDRLKKVAYWLLLNPETSERDAARMLISKLPKTRPLEKKKRVLKPMRMFEADRPVGDDLSSGYVDDEEWQRMIDSYLTDNIKVNRGPESVFDTGTPSDAERYVPHYGWEIEQEITQDFVYQVRQGQVAAARANGITEFIWIAIVDDKTDECCLWRDGLTTKEIEAELSKHDDDCDGAVVPPAHFNCRCSLAPATDDLPDVPESNESEFDTWINS